MLNRRSYTLSSVHLRTPFEKMLCINSKKKMFFVKNDVRNITADELRKYLF